MSAARVAEKIVEASRRAAASPDNITEYDPPCQGFDVLIRAGGRLMGREVEMLERVTQKETGGRVIYGMEPAALLKDLTTCYRAVHCGHPSCFG